MPIPVDQACLTCQFFDQDTWRHREQSALSGAAAQMGFCRKRAPTTVGNWPTCRIDDWCGEWEKVK